MLATEGSRPIVDGLESRVEAAGDPLTANQQVSPFTRTVSVDAFFRAADS